MHSVALDRLWIELDAEPGPVGDGEAAAIERERLLQDAVDER